MKVLSQNSERIDELKELMTLLLACSKDDLLDVSIREEYYRDYLSTAREYYLLMRSSK